MSVSPEVLESNFFLLTATAAISPEEETSKTSHGPPIERIRELTCQLDSWRSQLPQHIQWLDDEILDFPSTDPMSRRLIEPLFSPDKGCVPIVHKHNFDIVTALLRTYFYAARFTILCPFIYNALHFPEVMTPEDTNCCALAIKSCCLWPLTMAPPKNKKRLIPQIFTWTQKFADILLILHITRKDKTLRHISESQVNLEDMKCTAALMLEWIRDLKQMDRIAAWSWQILEPVYAGR